MKFAQLNPDGSLYRVLPNEPTIFDSDNYCTPELLVKDGRSEQFRVIEVQDVSPPSINDATQEAILNGVELIDGKWFWVWGVRDLSSAEVETKRISKVPTQVTMRQARLALLQSGLLDLVESNILSIPNEELRKATKIEWEYAQTVDRTSGLVPQMGATLGMSDRQIDDLFVLASTM